MMMKNGNSGISHRSLPSFLLHGFSAKPWNEATVPTAGDLENYIKQLPPLYSEPVTVRNADGTTTTTTRSDNPNVQAGYLVGAADKASDYSVTDLDSQVDLTKFMVSCTWESMTSAPYANANATFRMPAQLLSYLFHGEAADPIYSEDSQGEKGKASGFRFIEAGGWASIRFPTHRPVDPYRTVFFGKVLSINIKTSVDSNSIFNSTVNIVLGSFIQPLTLAETRKTYKRVGNIKDIDPAAISSYDAKQNVIIKGLARQLRDMRSGSNGVDMYDSLRYFITSLGHIQLPTDLAGRHRKVNAPLRLGDNIFLMGEYQDTTVGTIYSANAADINTIQGRPEEKYFTSALLSHGSTVWGLIASMFQPSSDLIELFPLIVPLNETGNALTMAAGGGATHIPVNIKTGEELALQEGGSITTSEGDRLNKETGEREFSSEWKNTPLTESLKAVLYIMYRYKPMPPNFYGDKPSVDNNNTRKNGLRPIVVGAETNHHKFFGTHSPYYDSEEVTVVNGERVTRTVKRKNSWNPEFIYVNEGQITDIDLSWSDMDRVNAINMSLPLAEGQTGSNLLFGVECVPVFNQEDINRHGLRMKNLHTPFASNGTAEHVRSFNRDASSGMSERLYYLIGEGHAYGSGRISLVYTPNPNLTAGVWCQTFFKQDLGSGSATAGFVSGSGGPDNNRSKPLTYYVTAVAHQVAIAPDTGAAQGVTYLTVERASYGNRIPAVSVNQVPRQPPPEPPKDTSRRKRRKPTRRRRRR